MNMEIYRQFGNAARDCELKEDYHQACINYIKAVNDCVSELGDDKHSDRMSVVYEAETMLSRMKYLLLQMNKSAISTLNPSLDCNKRKESVENCHVVGDLKNEDPMRKRLENVIIMEKPDVSFDKVIGMEDAKQALREALLVPVLYPGSGQAENAWTGVLLFGASGVGKTLLVKAVATEGDLTFISVKLESVLSKYFGESEQAIAKVIEIAEENSPSVLFIDEVDSLCSTRKSDDEGTRRLKNALLLGMDKLSAKRIQQNGKLSRVTVIGNTNLPQELDNAFRRRFPKRIHVALPNRKERTILISQELDKFEHNLGKGQINRLASITEKYSGSDIVTLITAAGMVQMRKALKGKSLTPSVTDIEKKPVRPISWSDVVFAKDSTPKANDNRTLAGLRTFNRKYGEKRPKVAQDIGNWNGIKQDCADTWDLFMNDLAAYLACSLCWKS